MPRRRKRKSNRNDLAVVKQIDSAGVDFFPFLLGMVTSLAVVFLIWNRFAPIRATENAVVDLTREIRTKEFDPDDFDVVVASKNPDQLANLMLELEPALQGKQPAEQVRVNLQYIQVADRMLAKDFSSEQMTLAKNTKLACLARIYGLNYVFKLGNPNIVQNFRDTANLYLQDSNPKLVRDAALALLKVNVFELPKLTSPSATTKAADEIVELLKRYPEDEFVSSTVRLVLNSYLEENERGGISLIQSLNARKREFTSAKILDIFQDCSDRTLLVSSGYQKKFDDRWVNGSVGQNELLKLSLDLLNHPDSGPLLILKIDEVAHWFEQENRHGNAIQLYEAMLNAGENGTNAASKRLEKEIAQAGLRRNNLVNKKIDLSGFAPDGSMILPEEFNNRVVVVIFWSNHNEKSIADLRQFHEETKSWQSKSITVIAVCVDEDAVDNVKRIAEPLDRFRFMVGDPSGGGTIHVLEQCPSTRVPRAMLIGKDGIVVDVNVPMGELKTDAEGILS